MYGIYIWRVGKLCPREWKVRCPIIMLLKLLWTWYMRRVLLRMGLEEPLQPFRSYHWLPCISFTVQSFLVCTWKYCSVFGMNQYMTQMSCFNFIYSDPLVSICVCIISKFKILSLLILLYSFYCILYIFWSESSNDQTPTRPLTRDSSFKY
jgi:hypothetical protein